MAKTKDTAADSTTKDDLTRPGKFSLEALLAGRLNPVKSHRVTVDPDTAAKIEALNHEKAQIELAMGQVEDLTQSKRRLAQKDDRKVRIDQIDAQVAELLPTLDGTWVEIQFRPMTQLEQDDVIAAKPSGTGQVAAAMWSHCAQIRADGSESEDDWSSLTAPEWVEFIEAIGIPQFQTLDRTVADLTYGRGVTPDFFAPSSKSQKTTTS